MCELGLGGYRIDAGVLGFSNTTVGMSTMTLVQRQQVGAVKN